MLTFGSQSTTQPSQNQLTLREALLEDCGFMCPSLLVRIYALHTCQPSKQELSEAQQQGIKPGGRPTLARAPTFNE